MFRKMILAACMLAVAGFASGQSLDFTLSATSSDGQSVVPKLTWATTPAATSCTGSGASAWAGTKAASGTQTLPAVNSTQAYVLVCSWPGVTKAVINWTPATKNTDGSNYTDPAGYKILYGVSATALTTVVRITDNAVLTWTSPDLTPGTWFFAMRSVNSVGLESDNGAVLSRAITASASQTRGLDLRITYPNPPNAL